MRNVKLPLPAVAAIALVAALLHVNAPARGQATPPTTARVILSVSEHGATINAGANSYTLAPPLLMDKDNKESKPVEATAASGEAKFRYAGGERLTLTARDGQFVLSFSGITAATPRYRAQMLLPFDLVLGGQWAAGSAALAPFPATFAGEQNVFSGSETRFRVMDGQGQGFSLVIPPYSFIQLQDNRMWNWKIFAWQGFVPLAPGDSTQVIEVAGAGAATPRPSALSDRFGQNTRAEWPGKVKSEAELKADIADEAAWLAALKTPVRDIYGGLPGSREKLGLSKTGFFHVEKKSDRWILVDPEGNAFFHLGICVSLSSAGDHTKIRGKEGLFEWLPGSDPTFRTAFRPDGPDDFSFYYANVIRKYGAPFDIDAHSRRMIERYRKWGFNSGGGFTGPTASSRELRYPYASTLPLGQWSGNMRSFLLPRVRGIFDPFHPGVAAEIDRNFAQSLPGNAADPLLIGYFLENEQAFEDIPRAIPSLTGDIPAKNELVKMLQTKYGTIDRFNTAWNLKAESFDALRNQGLAVSTREASADMQAYVVHFLDAYYKVIVDTYRKYDKNHMLIGNRWQPSTANNEALLRAAGKYMDVISVNYYTYGIDAAYLRRLYDWSGGKPFILSEYHYSSPKDSGLPGGLNEVGSQKERGLAYRNYVEQAASLGFVVGIEWFSAVDQPVTGRYFDGENGNIGLISVVDRPYRDLVAQMKTTNDDIYRVWMGERKPFVFDDPRFQASAKGGRKIVSAPRVAAAPALDGTATGWPGIPPTPIPGDRLVMGAEAAGLEASFRACHDGKFLYLSIDIRDATPMKNDHTGDALWGADGVEIFISGADLDQAGPLRFDDRQILIGVGEGGPKSYIANSSTQPALKMNAVASPDGKGYKLQVGLPLAELGIKAAPGAELLFDLAVDDSADGKQRLRQLMWNGIARNSSDRSQWGRLKLGE